jgi:hypothetical protein
MKPGLRKRRYSVARDTPAARAAFSMVFSCKSPKKSCSSCGPSQQLPKNVSFCFSFRTSYHPTNATCAASYGRWDCQVGVRHVRKRILQGIRRCCRHLRLQKCGRARPMMRKPARPMVRLQRPWKSPTSRIGRPSLNRRASIHARRRYRRALIHSEALDECVASCLRSCMIANRRVSSTLQSPLRDEGMDKIGIECPRSASASPGDCAGAKNAPRHASDLRVRYVGSESMSSGRR